MDRKSFIKKAGLGSAGLMGSSLAGSMGLFSGCGRQQQRPNIMVVMADDMGFSDIGCYGAEIQTPNLDGLAERGLRFTQFYNAARCCPTRASLMTGLHPHQTGIGHMTGDYGHDSYRGDLNDNCMTIAEVLGSGGYHTWMSGKWHVTKHIGQWTDDPDRTSRHNWPRQRGFDRFFGTILGAGSFYNPITLVEGNDPIGVDPDFYYTDAISGNAVQFVNDHAENGSQQPFFGYVSYTAPHWPLHALEEDIARYRGRYSGGWDQLRRERMQQMVDIGLLDPRWELTARDPRVPVWDDAEHKAWEERRMEVYAAQIDRMDRGIGQIVQALVQNGQLDNTLILFLADNGGCAEVLTEEWSGPFIPDETLNGEPVILGNKPEVTPGPRNTYQSYGIGWANASDTPFRLYKHYVHEGGIASPLIAHWPAGIEARGDWRSYPSHLVDIMATCVDIGRAEYPNEYNGQPIQPLEGRSLTPVFEEDQPERGEPLFWEHEGNRAVRDDRCKLLQRHNHDW
ncbi:MAG: arylsulfatase [Balneolaceae bacterium]|nr:arylsulfatase [Balneolaceae bacterium]